MTEYLRRVGVRLIYILCDAIVKSKIKSYKLEDTRSVLFTRTSNSKIFNSVLTVIEHR